jgi:hypothetical protein
MKIIIPAHEGYSSSTVDKPSEEIENNMGNN